MPAALNADAPADENLGGGDQAGDAPAESVEGADAEGEVALNAHGYPDATPLAEMTIEQQAAYWKHKSRIHEGRARAKDGALSAEEAQALREEIEQLRNASLSDAERAQADAVEAARVAGRDEARAELLPVLAEAKIRGYASTVLSGDKLEKFVATVNVDAFRDADGEVDGAALVEHLKLLFGDTPDKQPSQTYPNFGQGSRGAGFTKAPARDAGLAEAQRRFGKPSN
ncbi:hypothetical protein ACIGO9_28775 [Nocardia asteroides]|uniref:hypothetical protein n=1 Tax=Nocardia asteroides TaxID=1824 RepID=UPI0037C8FC17